MHEIFAVSSDGNIYSQQLHSSFQLSFFPSFGEDCVRTWQSIPGYIDCY